jgi:N-acetylglutamate synthase-like GNAT family acetyltransferase
MQLRPATQTDQPTIRQMINAAHINPMNVDWRHFIVAEEDGRIVGIGQVKTHGDETRELASLAVIPEQQRRGIASTIIRTLIEREPGPLFLTCRDELVPFYTRFGFRVLEPKEMSPYFRRLDRLARVFLMLAGRRAHMNVMKRESA